MLYIKKQFLATLYANLIRSVPEGYDITSKERRKAAYVQLTKKETVGTVDLEQMNNAFNLYLKETEKEFTEYLDGLK